MKPTRPPKSINLLPLLLLVAEKIVVPIATKVIATVRKKRKPTKGVTNARNLQGASTN